MVYGCEGRRWHWNNGTIAAPSALSLEGAATYAGAFGYRVNNTYSSGRAEGEFNSPLSDLRFGAGSSPYLNVYTSGAPLAFQLVGIEKMRLDSNGNVGIGTTSPQAILDVNGSGTTQSAMIVPRDSTAARPTGINGMLRYNTNSNVVETFANGAWNSVATSASGGGASQWTTSGAYRGHRSCLARTLVFC